MMQQTTQFDAAQNFYVTSKQSQLSSKDSQCSTCLRQTQAELQGKSTPLSAPPGRCRLHQCAPSP